MTAVRRAQLAALMILVSLAAGWGAAKMTAGRAVDGLLLLRHVAFGDLHKTADSPVVIVAIDDATLRRGELDSLPLALWGPKFAAVLNAVGAAGPRAIGLDVILATSAESALPGYDKPLIQAVRTGAAGGTLVLARAEIGGRRIDPHPIFAFLAGPANIRSIGVVADSDGIVRRFPNAGGMGDSAGMAQELAQRAGAPVASAPGQLLNFADRAPAPIYSFGDVLSCAERGAAADLKAAFVGKVVLIGADTDAQDRKTVSGRWFLDSPLGDTRLACGAEGQAPKGASSTVPGVLVHAQAVLDLVRGERLIEVGLAPLAVTMLLGSLVGYLIGRVVSMWIVVGLTLGACAAMIAAALMTLQFGLLLSPIGAASALIASVLCSRGFRGAILERERRHVRQALSRYLDTKVVRALVDTDRPLQLGGEAKNLTIWFSDMADFTRFAGSVAPQQVVERLNRYFDLIARHVEGQGGIIDKFLGDGVLAIFGAPLDQPDHASRAVAAAIGVQREMANGAMDFDLRIGLNSGVAIVGNVGTVRRYDYTAIGDVVNMAQRIETLNKQFGTRVLMSAATAHAAGDPSRFRSMGSMAVKGGAQPVEVFALASEVHGTATQSELPEMR